MEKFYITTAIAYTNARPHIGHALEFLQADVIARYQRLSGKEVRYLTGTDEYGTKIMRTAEKNGKKPQKFVDEIAQTVKDLDSKLEIYYDDFIRTTDRERHWPSVHKIWQKLLINNDLYKKSYKGYYCVGHESFIKESDLEEGICPDHKTKPEVIEEENYFFRLSKYADRIKKAIESGELKIVPEFRKKEILTLLEEGLEDVSFSRPSEKLSWGIPVPGDETQTVYVWTDALTNYISALGYDKESPLFKKFWPADVQCIGKDILRFHAAIWPAMLLSAGLALPKCLFVHGHIISGGQKMSKTLGNVIDPFEMIEKYGAEAVRYYLMREIPPVQDGDFTIEKFESRYSADLVNGLGNLLNRVLTLAEKNPSLIQKQGEFKQVAKTAEDVWQRYNELMAEFKFNEALEQAWSLVRLGNEYVDQQKIWELPEKDPQKFGLVIAELLLYLGHIASLIEPFLPKTSQAIFNQLGIDQKSGKEWILQLNPKKGPVLFKRLGSAS